MKACEDNEAIMLFLQNTMLIKNGCLIYMGAKSGANKKSYGRIWCSGRRVLQAHRFSYELHYGVNPGDLRVLHSCDNPSCVNPQHLSLGTDADNMRDKMLKGRCSKHLAKLKIEQIEAIKQDLKTDMSPKMIAEKYAISRRNIYDIRAGKIWRDVCANPMLLI